MTDVEVFQFPATGQEVRITIRADEPWFVIADVCRVLDLSNPSMAASRLDADDLSTTEVTDSLGRAQQAKITNEAGLYDLMLMSRKPEARNLKRWVTHEVLPALRKTGRYEMAPLDEIEVARRYLKALEDKKALEAANAAQAKELTSTRPKVEYVDAFVHATGDLTTIRAFAGQLGMTEPALRAFLVDRKVIYRRLVGTRRSKSKDCDERQYQWLAYAGYVNWFTARDQPEAPPMHNGQLRQTLYVTPVGKAAIRRLLDRHPPTDLATREDRRS